MSRSRLAVHSTPTRALRCAICHDDAKNAATCPGCASVFHVECREELARCPSLGCQALAPMRSPLQLRDRFRIGRAFGVSFLSVLISAPVALVALLLGQLRQFDFHHGRMTQTPAPMSHAEIVAWGLFALACFVHFIVLPVRWTRQASPEVTRRDALRSVLAVEVMLTLLLGIALAGAPVPEEAKWLLAAALAVVAPPITAHIAAGRSIL